MKGTDAASAPYPAAQRSELIEHLHGRPVADPYRRAPVLIRSEVEVGHSVRAVSRTVPLITDQLCFLAQYTGLDLEAVHTR